MKFWWFSEVGLACKGWTFSAQDPTADVVEERGVVSVWHLKWYSKLDLKDVRRMEYLYLKK